MSFRIAQVLFTHRITLHNTTGISPAELLLGRRLRIKLDLIRPNTAKRAEEKQDAQRLSTTVQQRLESFNSVTKSV